MRVFLSMANENDNVSVQEWSNSLAYLQRISYLEDAYIQASTDENVNKMILHLRNLVSVLKRMRKSTKSRSNDLFDPESDLYWEKKLVVAKRLNDISLRADNGNPAMRNFNNLKRSEAVEVLRDLYEDLGDFQMKNNLTFKEGVDPWNAVFEG